MEASEIIAANRLRRTKGEDARIAEYARLFNEKYSESQEIRHVELTNSDRRFFELHHMRSIGILTPEEGDEYQRLLNEWITHASLIHTALDITVKSMIWKNHH